VSSSFFEDFVRPLATVELDLAVWLGWRKSVPTFCRLDSRCLNGRINVHFIDREWERILASSPLYSASAQR
jgi:hypothetical protein